MKVEIQQLTKEEEWIPFKLIEGDNAWTDGIKEVCSLNMNGKERNYRALYINGFLTHIYCNGFYMVPTIRYY